MNRVEITELKAWREDARRGLEREVEQLREKEAQIVEYLKALDATDGLLERKEAEIAELRQQLLEEKNRHLEAERLHLAAEVSAKPTEIHNHFESGSSAQVFNDRVTGRFGRKQNLKKNNKQEKEKKRWKKVARRIL